MTNTNLMTFTAEQLEQMGQKIIDALIFQWDYLVFEILDEGQREQWYAERDKFLETTTKTDFRNQVLKSELFLRGLAEAEEIVLGIRFNDPNDTIWGGENYVDYERHQ
jgi:hypothetical protein